MSVTGPDMVPPAVRVAALRASHDLSKVGAPHALIGGIAYGAYAPPRTTGDVDFLIPHAVLRAILGTPLADVVEGKTVKYRIGNTDIDVDFIAPPRIEGVPSRVWADLLSRPRVVAGLPLISLEGLVLLKVHANPAKDNGDVVEILKAQGPRVAAELRRWLVRNVRDEDVVADFDVLAMTAEREAAGRRNPRPGGR